MIKFVDIEIFEIDCMVFFIIEANENFEERDVLTLQLNYLNNCPIEVKEKLIEMYRDMNFPSEKSDDELWYEMLSNMSEDNKYDYELLTVFDDVFEVDGKKRSNVCYNCKDTYNLHDFEVNDDAMGVCGLEGCYNEAFETIRIYDTKSMKIKGEN